MTVWLLFSQWPWDETEDLVDVFATREDAIRYAEANGFIEVPRRWEHGKVHSQMYMNYFVHESAGPYRILSREVKTYV